MTKITVWNIIWVMVIEAFRRRFRGNPSVNPRKDLDYILTREVIEPASGQEKEELENELRSLIQKESFDGADFNKFVSNMIKLLGGVQSTSLSGVETPVPWTIMKSTVDLIDRERGVAISFSRSIRKPLDFATIMVVPIEERVPQTEPTQREPKEYISQDLGYGVYTGLGYTIGNETLTSPPIVTTSLHLPPQFLSSQETYITEGKFDHISFYNPATTLLSPKETQDFCQRVLNVFKMEQT